MEISEIIKLDWVNGITNRISVVRKESWAVPLTASPKTFPQHLAGKHASFICMQPMDFSQTPHTVFYYCCYIWGWIQTTPIGNCKQKARQKSPCPSRDWPSPSPSCLILKVAQRNILHRDPVTGRASRLPAHPHMITAAPCGFGNQPKAESNPGTFRILKVQKSGPTWNNSRNCHACFRAGPKPGLFFKNETFCLP